MNPQAFVQKWKVASGLTERAACQSHFNDLCDLLGQPKPTDADPSGTWFTFEKGVTTTENRKGFADVWRRGFFGWEYKGKHKDLTAAYQQLLKYREALLNPPLLVVCDLDRFEVHTNFPNTAKAVRRFALDDLPDPHTLATLRALFTNPDQLRPDHTQAQVTADIAERFTRLAAGMRGRGVAPDAAAHFLMKLMFCMFAEDIQLLPEKLFETTVRASRSDPARLATMLADLFAKMAAGGHFGVAEVAHFNGGLFADADVIPLERAEIDELLGCAACDWSAVEPSIFGTLFERCLDPTNRTALGAHYTSRADIETLLGPVLRDPLRREWDAVRAKADALWEKVQEENKKVAGQKKTVKVREKAIKARAAFDAHVHAFFDRLAHVSVLDPACGSGNFLYVALRMILDLEKEVWVYANAHDLPHIGQAGPHQLHGIERNEYAQQLAQVVIWIGYLQWMKESGVRGPGVPVLDKMDNIERRDAILDLTDPDNPKEPDWPDAEFIVGNPPFLGGKMLRANLGDDYVQTLFRMYGGGGARVKSEADLCCYWFEKARSMIKSGRTMRAGLLATQGIRGGANRDVLARIKQSGDIFFAVSDRDWFNDGAAVHISMIGFDDGTETARTLDGQPVSTINANLTSAADSTQAHRLAENLGVGFMGDTKGGPFDIPYDYARRLLETPNVNGRPSSDVVVPWCNGLDVTRRNRDVWIIDYPLGLPREDAEQYDSVFGYLKPLTEAARAGSRSKVKDWWLHERPRVEMRRALRPLGRFLVTPNVTKFRLFVWMAAPTLADHQLIAYGYDNDVSLGVLHSRAHEVWALRLGTRLEDRPRYTPTTCFETFPFPTPTAAQREAIAAAAKELDALRANWLNPPEWTRTETLEFPGSVTGPWRRYVTDVDAARGVGTVRYPRTVAKDAAAAAKLKSRTLTNLYNERPAWLAAAHRRLDEAVAAAYGWPADLPDDDLLARLLALNLERAFAGPAAPAEPGE